LVKLALCNGELDGLVLVAIHRLVLRIPRLVAVFEELFALVVVFSLDNVIGFTLALVIGCVWVLLGILLFVGILIRVVVRFLLVIAVVVGELPLEELDVTEISCSAAWVETPSYRT
jgi:hypothetical protein